MQADHETWYAIRLCFNLDDPNNVVQIFKRVRVAKLIDGFYLCCSCGLHTHIGIGCAHVTTMINEITVYI